MAVDKSIMFATMKAILEHRASKGFTTQERTLRLILEFGAEPVEKLLDKSPILDNGRWLSEDQSPQASCWINLKGYVFWIDYGYHSAFAGILTGKSDPSILEDAGWVHVSDKRMDVVMEPTPAQERAMQELEAQRGFRRNGGLCRPGRRPSRDGRLHMGFEVSPRTDYMWDDVRYWEDRGIPRVAHGYAIRPFPDTHMDVWLKVMHEALFDEMGAVKFNPEVVPCLEKRDRYVPARAAREYNAYTERNTAL